MRRRRKQRFTWFPSLGTDYGASGGITTVYESQDLGWDSADSATVGQLAAIQPRIPLLPDFDVEPSSFDASSSLRDRVEGKDYVVKRVVGKTWIAMPQYIAGTEENIISRVVACVALGVFPCTESGNIAPGVNSDPLDNNNVNQPWMWRRTWVLSNQLATTPGTGVTSQVYLFPNSTAAYGSVLDGGHLDCKSARRVRKEERLFFCASAVATEVIGVTDNTGLAMRVGFDLRVLGAMRRSANKSIIT